MDIDPSTTKYVIKADLKASGVVEKPDVVGAIFGQTEGLLGDELDLRDLQKSGRMGRIEVEVSSSKGKSSGKITIPSSLDLVETSILAAALETIDRVGPCKADIEIDEIKDVRESKRNRIVERAKDLLSSTIEESKVPTGNLTESVRQEVQMEEISDYGESHSPAGPNVDESDAIIVVEGRSDVLNLLRYGIKNAIAVEGTDIPDEIKDLSTKRVTTAFVDGDRGGMLILQELLETAEVDYVAEAPENTEVEELTQKQIMKALRSKIPVDQYLEMYDIDVDEEEVKESGGYQRAKKAAKGKQASTGKSSSESREEQREELGTKKEYDQYRKLIDSIDKEKIAKLLNGNGEVLEEVPTRELADKLLEKDQGVEKVVFNGIVTQRLVDIATEKGIKKLIGRKVGNIPKLPTSLEVLPWDRLKNN
ncbi:MAG: DNA primase [Candidatus Thermoplasmatota archaeon]|nr:DNA primase [Candidatus Thermoplasmatota archaeon]MBS3790260.1 DNA primase [Candidatus Thermoplasmatota archaeon]